MKRLLMILLAMMLLAPAVLTETEVLYIDGRAADRVHLRAKPSLSAESLGLYFTGTGVTVHDQADGWAHVTIGDVQGYMVANYLIEEQLAPRGPWQVVENPDSAWVNLRMAPSTQGVILSCPDNGDVVQLLGETADGWSYVDGGEVKGYIMTSLLSPLGEEKSTRRTTILNESGWEAYIHQYIAPNGQALYFTADLLEPMIEFEDVNFDGYDDIVITTGRYAKCDTARFYVYDPSGEYVLVRETALDEGLMNYALYPEYGLVGTHIANGDAGLCHETCLYRWEGNDLECIRRAYSDNYTETVWAENMSSCTKTTYTDLFCCNVYDYTTGEPEGTIIYSVGPLGFDEFLETYDAENAALWQDLK